VRESHSSATKTNDENLHNSPSIPLWTLHLARARARARARRERETKILFLRATPMENVVPNFRSPYPVDSIPPCIGRTRRATMLGDSTTWRFYVVARCASARRRNRIYPPLRHGIGGSDVCSNLIESNRTIIEPDRLLSREASGSADATVRTLRWRRNH